MRRTHGLNLEDVTRADVDVTEEVTVDSLPPPGMATVPQRSGTAPLVCIAMPSQPSSVGTRIV